MKILLVCIVFTVFLAQNVFAYEFVNHKFDYFKIWIPNGFEIKVSSPVEDFEIYTIEKNGKKYVTIYVGNQPNFPRVKTGNDKVSIFRVNNVQINSTWLNGGGIAREFLIKLGIKGWPNYIHAWIVDNLSSEDVVVADQILMSIEVDNLR